MEKNFLKNSRELEPKIALGSELKLGLIGKRRVLPAMTAPTLPGSLENDNSMQ